MKRLLRATCLFLLIFAIQSGSAFAGEGVVNLTPPSGLKDNDDVNDSHTTAGGKRIQAMDGNGNDCSAAHACPVADANGAAFTAAAAMTAGGSSVAAGRTVAMLITADGNVEPETGGEVGLSSSLWPPVLIPRLFRSVSPESIVPERSRAAHLRTFTEVDAMKLFLLLALLDDHLSACRFCSAGRDRHLQPPERRHLTPSREAANVQRPHIRSRNFVYPTRLTAPSAPRARPRRSPELITTDSAGAVVQGIYSGASAQQYSGDAHRLLAVERSERCDDLR